MPLGREEAFTVKWVQLLDAALVWLAFWLASLFRKPIREFSLGSDSYSGDLELWQMSWILYLVVPLTPFVLALFHFYQRPRPKSSSVAFGQLFKGLICMTLLVGGLILWAEAGAASRLILIVAGILTLLVLYLRDRLFSALLDR